MAKKRVRSYREGVIHPVQSKKDAGEFGPGKKEFLMCPDCTIWYYEKSWHHTLGDFRHLTEDKAVAFKRCPACEMIRSGKFEGEVILKTLPEKRLELYRLIENAARRAFERDPLDRVIRVTFSKKTGRISTTENQLAVAIAKQIQKAFKGELRIKWSRGEDTVRITWFV